MKIIILALLLTTNSYAGCNNYAPRAEAFVKYSTNSCPGGYYSSGGYCIPTSSNSNYAFEISGNSGCPSGYYNSGSSCVATSQNSCDAYYNGGRGCPGGYRNSGNYCVSN